MLDIFQAFLNGLLGLDLAASDLRFRHMAWRALVVFVFAVLLARVADRRVLGHNAGFDIVLLVVLGSVLSRAINGQAAFFPTLAASALLVGLHRMAGTFAFYSHGFSQLLKGRAHVLVRNGQIQRRAMEHGKITADDLDENLRLNGGVGHVERVAEARLERNGTISVVRTHDAGPPKSDPANRPQSQ